MKNTIYLDSDFNFLLLECEETETPGETRIFLNIPTNDSTGQRLDISVAGGAVTTASIASEAVVNFELTSEFWADNDATTITPKNDDTTGTTITLNFPGTFTTGAALNYIADDEFEIAAQTEEYAAQNTAMSGAGGGYGSGALDFVEIIRNIGFRLLEEPTNVNIVFDEAAREVQIKWTDPPDISTDEPAPATWAGTVVVRKEGSAPLHKWDGVLIVDSTTRDQYASTPLIDNNINDGKTYYYGIFPYDTKGDYRYTKAAKATTIENIPKEYIFPNELTMDSVIPVTNTASVSEMTLRELVDKIKQAALTDLNAILIEPWYNDSSYSIIGYYYIKIFNISANTIYVADKHWAGTDFAQLIASGIQNDIDVRNVGMLYKVVYVNDTWKVQAWDNAYTKGITAGGRTYVAPWGIPNSTPPLPSIAIILDRTKEIYLNDASLPVSI